MAVGTPKGFQLGKGELKFGETGTEVDFACQVTEVKVTWDNDSEDDLHTLCGGVLPGGETFTAKLEGTFIQDLSSKGVIDFTWANKGQTVKVAFKPRGNSNASVKGEVKIMPIDIGGEVNKTNTSDFEFPFVGEPTWTNGGTSTSANG
ncbi:hypothetical protein V5S96_10230 [Corynebacterium mastitidis]|uniref:Phage tail protein n=1 Tax=Corynebacterium mastitidis TaxID=161890 RepID=A0ABU8P0E4_9CORY